MARVDFRSIQSNADAHGRQILFSMVNVRVVVKLNPGDKPSLLANSDFFFLILLKISHYTQLTQLFPTFLLSLHSVGTRLTPHSVGLIRLRNA